MPVSTNHDDALEARATYAYDPTSGRLFWKVARTHWLKIGDPADTSMVRGYRNTFFQGKTKKAHRVIWLMVHGRWPPYDIDHINGDRQDNRIVNLREATRAQNAANMMVKRLGLKGAYFFKRQDRWVSAIRVQGRQLHLGYFATEPEAHQAYIDAARRHYGEFARAA